MSAKTAARPTTLLNQPLVWALAWFVAWVIARIALESPSVPPFGRIVVALLPTPIAGAALFTIIRGARALDELEQRIQLEALAFAFVLAVLLLMTLGLMELAIALNPDDWSYRHVWAMLPALYFAGLVIARRRYA